MTPDLPAAECRFAGLRLDAVDAHGVATVWAALLGRGLEAAEGGGWRTVPSEPDHDQVGLVVLPVTDPGSGTGRVRLDVQLAAHDVVAPLSAGMHQVAAPGNGASWWVLADPEGNRFHAMPPPPPELHVPPVPETTPFEVAVEAADPEALAQWWAARTGGRARTRSGVTFWWVEGAAGFPLMFWMFVQQSAPGTGPSRMHWDVTLADDSPQSLLDAGAGLRRAPDDRAGCWLLTDPEGNEFRAFPPTS